jgi:hypothetical protein
LGLFFFLFPQAWELPSFSSFQAQT